MKVDANNTCRHAVSGYTLPLLPLTRKKENTRTPSWLEQMSAHRIEKNNTFSILVWVFAPYHNYYFREVWVLFVMASRRRAWIDIDTNIILINTTSAHKGSDVFKPMHTHKQTKLSRTHWIIIPGISVILVFCNYYLLFKYFLLSQMCNKTM